MVQTSNEVLWYKSTRSSGQGDCVEVAMGPDVVRVRDSKDRQGTILAFDLPAWRIFLDNIRTGKIAEL